MNQWLRNPCLRLSASWEPNPSQGGAEENTKYKLRKRVGVHTNKAICYIGSWLQSISAGEESHTEKQILLLLFLGGRWTEGGTAEETQELDWGRDGV